MPPKPCRHGGKSSHQNPTSGQPVSEFQHRQRTCQKSRVDKSNLQERVEVPDYAFQDYG